VRRVARDPLIGEDPRWGLLLGPGLPCAGCGQRHQGVVDLGWPHPVQWPGGKVASNQEVRLEGDFLSEDLCVVGGEAFFVRCLLPVPLLGAPGALGLRVWASLARPNFERYVAAFQQPDDSALGPWFGWLCTRIPGWPDTEALPADVIPHGDRQRPRLRLHPGAHPLVAEQRAGIGFDRLLEIYAANGHDLTLRSGEGGPEA
jgi:hypothetical protein